MPPPPPPPPPTPDKMGRFPAWYDAAEGRAEALAAALQTGVPVDHADKDRMTMLSVAAFYGRTTAVRLLLESGADSNLADRHGNGPLWHATREASQQPRPESAPFDQQIVAMLLAAGADPHHRNRADRTPPGWAAWSPELQAIYRSAGYEGAFEL
ncbi:MAG: ankyrin repeat domain-containing protein [Porphyrobacter sp.]|nr:ankyrin repeat domain-containing protein [Porphyrobacter sp.]